MDFTILMPILGGGVRSILGWMENALKDGIISAFEWGKLAGTVVEIAVLALSAAYGLGVDATSATGIGVLLSFLISGLKSKVA